MEIEGIVVRYSPQKKANFRLAFLFMSFFVHFIYSKQKIIFALFKNKILNKHVSKMKLRHTLNLHKASNLLYS